MSTNSVPFPTTNSSIDELMLAFFESVSRLQAGAATLLASGDVPPALNLLLTDIIPNLPRQEDHAAESLARIAHAVHEHVDTEPSAVVEGVERGDATLDLNAPNDDATGSTTTQVARHERNPATPPDPATDQVDAGPSFDSIDGPRGSVSSSRQLTNVTSEPSSGDAISADILQGDNVVEPVHVREAEASPVTISEESQVPLLSNSPESGSRTRIGASTHHSTAPRSASAVTASSPASSTATVTTAPVSATGSAAIPGAAPQPGTAPPQGSNVAGSSATLTRWLRVFGSSYSTYSTASSPRPGPRALPGLRRNAVNPSSSVINGSSSLPTKKNALTRQGAFYEKSHPDIYWDPAWGEKPRKGEDERKRKGKKRARDPEDDGDNAPPSNKSRKPPPPPPPPPAAGATSTGRSGRFHGWRHY